MTSIKAEDFDRYLGKGLTVQEATDVLASLADACKRLSSKGREITKSACDWRQISDQAHYMSNRFSAGGLEHTVAEALRGYAVRQLLADRARKQLAEDGNRHDAHYCRKDIADADIPFLDAC